MTDERAPQVSVLMTVYNGGSYLAEAIASVLAQDFADFELLVVDDASTDESPAVLRRFAQDDARVRVFRCEVNGGPVTASNLGLSHARGALLARLDADDMCRPGRLGRQVTAFRERPDLVLLGSAFDYIDAQGRCIGQSEPPLDDATLNPMLVTVGNPFCHSTVMMRADAVRRLGGYRQLVNRFALDYDLIMRLADMGAVANLQDRLVGYRIHPGQITAQKMAMQIRSAHVYRALALQRRRGEPEDLRRAVADVDAAPGVLREALLGGYLYWARMMGAFDRTEARRLLLRAMRLAPWDRRVHWMLMSQWKRSLVGALRG